jgi:hypothetical protein
LSTLTKVLIVLQTVFSVFLCGIVITYVGNADSYKDKYDTANRSLGSARQVAEQADKDYTEFKAQKEAEFAKAGQDMQALTDQISAMKLQVNEALLAKRQAEGEAANMASAAKASNETAVAQTELFKTAQAQLTAGRQEQVKQKKALQETDDLLIQKMAIIAAQDQRLMLLTEEKTDVQGKLEQYLHQYGKAAGAPRPATQLSATARQARPIMQDIGLKGLVTGVDIPNSLAEISVGMADGVKKEMTFKVTRGDKFVCNILVVDVDAEKAVGDLQLVQLPPRKGDKVSTNLNF